MCKYYMDWEATVGEHSKNLIEGQKIILNSLIKEISEFEYTTIAQVNGSLASHLERLKGEQYEIDVKLDHMTENQFPNA